MIHNVSPKPERHPTVCRLVADGTVRKEALGNGAYLYHGTASDGTDVDLGQVFTARDLDVLEAYLAAHPAPSEW